MNKIKQRIGQKGEKIARQFLLQLGYKIIARNFLCRFGEIDIIAKHERTIVFIEVKTRSSDIFGLPQEAIRKDKIKHLRRCAQFYIKNYADPEENFRFDAVSIVLSHPPQIELIKNAF